LEKTGSRSFYGHPEAKSPGGYLIVTAAVSGGAEVLRFGILQTSLRHSGGTEREALQISKDKHDDRLDALASRFVAKPLKKEGVWCARHDSNMRPSGS
jgi:hypothetical protein